MRLRMMAVAVMLSACSPLATAQMNMGAAAKPAAGAMTEPAKALDDMLTLYEGEVLGAAKAMPAEKYSFAPSAAIFVPSQTTDYKGVRTFGEMVLHIAQANYYYASAFGAMKPDVDLKALGNLKTKDEIVAALVASFAFTHKAIATLTIENAFDAVRGDNTRASLAGGVVAHGFDHYGQLVEYLRMNGIVPPASAK